MTTASATWFCGGVQIMIPVEGDDLIETFTCHCTDCRKITASMFASNFMVNQRALKHIRGQDKITVFSQSSTIASGNTMTNHFCSICGTLMYRCSSGYPDMAIPRIGTVDDLTLHETKLRPKTEIFTKSRVCWLSARDDMEQLIEGHPVRPKKLPRL
ncbi:hypothetical protein B9Z65_734 [Elsinoe australis]|uniref:CENP-V/GFA domain-containing protein n=1 Tax=Elsinoe australis TaxID=40998 RepID=A0A2P8AJH2_9PEZI|nr:hypothetical protein B9Z65_734 [Elsinoe australis]